MAFQKAKALQEAEKSVAQGRISQAILQYQLILNNDPADVSLFNTIGDLYIRDRNITEGLKQFHKLAEAYTRDGFNVKAIAIYRKISKVDPNSVDTLLKLAELYQLQGLSREAREQYLQAAEFFKKRKQMDRVLEVLRKLVQLDPENVKFRTRLATECEQAGKREEAAQAHLKVAEILIRHDDQAAAEEALKKAAELDPKNSKIQLLRARVAIAHGQPEEAERVINSSPELQSDSAAKRILLDAYLGTRKLPEAEKLVIEVFHSNPTDFAPIANLSGLLVEKGDIEEAFQLLSSVADLMISQNNAGPVLEALRRIGEKAPHHLPTLELIQRIGEQTADEARLPEVLEALGHVYTETGDLEKAEAVYLKLVGREPDNESYHGLLNAVQQKLGREGKPEEPATTKEVALVAQEQEEEEDKVPPLVNIDADQEAVVKEALENSDLFARYNLPEKAIAELDKVLQIYPDQIEIHQRILEISHKGFPERGAAAAAQLARIFAERGDQETAAKYQAIVSAKGPLQEIPPSPLPSIQKAKEPAPPPVTPERGITAEFPISAISPEEPLTAAVVAPPSEPVFFDLTPPEAPSESSVAPPLPPSPALAEPPVELDLSEDLEALAGFGYQPIPTSEPTPSPPAPMDIVAPIEAPVLPEEPAPPPAVVEQVAPEIVEGTKPEVVEEAKPETVEEVLPEIGGEVAPLTEVPSEPSTSPGPELPTEAPEVPPSPKEEGVPADLQDSKIEVEFYLENGFIEEAELAVAALDEKYPGSAFVAALRRQVHERTGEPSPAEPWAQAVPTEEAIVAESPVGMEFTEEAAPAEHPPVLDPAGEPVVAGPPAEFDQTLPPELAQIETPMEGAPPPVQPLESIQPEAITPEIGATEPEFADEALPAELTSIPFQAGELHIAQPPANFELTDEASPPELDQIKAQMEEKHLSDQPVEGVHAEAPLEPLTAEGEPEHEEWELPTSYAASAQPEATLGGSAPPALRDSVTQTPVAEGAASRQNGGMDLLDELAIDFASSIDGLSVPEELPPAIPDVSSITTGTSPANPSQGAAQLSGLLAEMEEPGAATTAKDDPETHYNLGVAFREMGLLDEAIGEFQKVVKGAGKGKYPANFLQTCSLLAICFMEKKMPTIAVKWYLRALETPDLDEEATMALQYDLGVAYEQAGDPRKALERFIEVYSQNIDFRDVAEKIRELQQKA